METHKVDGVGMDHLFCCSRVVVVVVVIVVVNYLCFKELYFSSE